MDDLFQKISFQTSRLVTTAYSTSFSIGVRALDVSLRDAIYSIYGFVRFADEIVDSFHEYNKQRLISDFESEYYEALKEGISLNPIINAFQLTVKKYAIGDDLVSAFLSSMKSDLTKSQFTEEEIKTYIYGSADVVGLMCLRVFLNGDDESYERLKPYAMRLGTAFQKINFLRDLKHDTTDLHRTYFPVLKTQDFDERTKKIILDDIYEDFNQALIGIKQLPSTSTLGVYVAYRYYLELTKRIERIPADKVASTRVSVPNLKKIILFCQSYLDLKLGKW